MAFSTKWPEVILGDHVDLLAGFAFKSKNFTDDPEDIPLVKGANVHQGYIDWAGAKFWPRSEFEKHKKFALEEGDVVIAMDRPWIEAGLKYSWIKPGDPKSLLVQRVARLRGTNELRTDYIRYLIGSHYFTDYIKPIVTGVSVPHISPTQIKGFRFRLPPLETQRKIASILSAYDDLIENNIRRIKILEEMAQAIYREWFVNFRFPGHEKVRMVDSPLGRVPEGWECASFAQAAVFENGDRGKNYPSGSDFVDKGIPFINAGHLVDGAVDLANVNHILEEKFGQLRSGKIRKGDLLFCLRGSPGRTARTSGITHGAIASSLVIIRPTERANEEFLYYTLAGEVGKQMAAKLNNGAAQPNVSVGSVQKYPLLLPPQGLLNRFAQLIEPIWEHIEILRNQLSNLNKQRDLLLPYLLSGQIKVGRGA